MTPEVIFLLPHSRLNMLVFRLPINYFKQKIFSKSPEPIFFLQNHSNELVVSKDKCMDRKEKFFSKTYQDGHHSVPVVQITHGI